MGGGQTPSARWFRLLYGLLSLLMCLAFIAFIAFSYATWSNVKLQAYESLAPHNKGLKDIVGRFISHQESLLGGLADGIDVDFSEVLQPRLVDIQQATPAMRVLAVLDSRGDTLVSTGEIKTLQWLDLFDSPDAVIGRPFRPTFVGEIIIPIRKPIVNARGALQGYVVAAYRLIGNNAIWHEAQEEESRRRSMIVGKDGRVYVSYPESDTFWQSFVSQSVDDSLLATFAELASVTTPETRTVKYLDNDLLVTASELNAYQLYIVSGIENADLLSRWFERMKFVALAMVLFLVLGLLVFRVIIARASQAESAKKLAEKNVFKLSLAIEQSPSSVIVTDSQWEVSYANKRLADELGNARPVTPGQPLLEHFPHTLLKPDVTTIIDNLSHGNNWYGERRAKEEKQWYSFSVSAMTDDRGRVTDHVIVTQNITDRKLAEVRLYKQANFDALTGLPNRRRTNDLLAEALKQAWKADHRLAVFYMDVDNFKQINDTFGHLLGDQVLQLVAMRLQQTVSGIATACHMSGDEFLVFMAFDDKTSVEALAQKILNAIKEPVELEGKKLFSSVSIGIASYPEDSADVSGLLKHADIALYESKNRGRRCYSFFDRELDERNKRKIELESEIRTALANQEIFMAYQTKNRISSEEVYGFEALMRWNSAKLGFVSPEEFITAAEEIGVIDKLGEFALRQACEDLKRYQQFSERPLSMAVNVSMRQLTDSDIVGSVRRVLEQTGVSPSALELEITESMLAQSLESVQPVLNELLALGVSLSIDDFGTGYSSLSYLTRFPVSTLKIDRCFVKDMVQNKSDATLTHTVIGMAHKLGLKVVAEGIEDADQLALLRVYGCDIGQGYYFTKPLNFEQMSKHLQSTQEKPDWAI